MSASFWAIKAAKSKKNEVVPGTSKWVANELYCMNSEVLTHTEMFYQDLRGDIDELNDFMRKALEGQDNKIFVESLTERDENETKAGDIIGELGEDAAVEGAENGKEMDVVRKQEGVDITSNFTYISPEHRNEGTLIDGDGDKSNNPQSSPVIAPTNANTNTNSNTAHATSRYTPKTPSPLKNNQDQDVHPSLHADLSFIPIANTINPKKGIPPKLESPYREQEPTNQASDDDSFQAISTAIRKSIAGKSAIHNPRTSQFIHVDTPKKKQNNAPENLSRINNRATIGALSHGSLNDSGSISVPLKREPASVRKSMNKTPKRASVFVSLPSREPITISSSSNNSGKGISEIKSRSLRVFEKLEIASRNENTGNLSPGTLKKRKLQRDTESHAGFNSTYIKESLKRRSSRPLLNDNIKPKEGPIKILKSEEEVTDENKWHINEQRAKKLPSTVPGHTDHLEESSKPQYEFKSDNHNAIRIPASEDLPVKSAENTEKILNLFLNRNAPTLVSDEEIKEETKNRESISRSPSKSPVINSIGSVLRRARNVFMSNPKSVGLRYDSASFSTGTGSPNRKSSSRSPEKHSSQMLIRERTKSPVRSSTVYNTQRSRSPTKLLSMAGSETTSRASSRINVDLDAKAAIEPKIIQGKAEVDLINRLMAPTSASAAKNVKTPSRKTQDGKRNEISSKNKFLTTTLNPTKPQFNPIKSSSRSDPSPLKKSIPLNDEQEMKETKIPSRLEFSNIPSLKKKSLMAERSEAAAQKPRQKIMIAMNHKLDNKLLPNPSPVLKNDIPNHEKTNEGKRSSNFLNDNSEPQQTLKPGTKLNYGKLTTLPEATNIKNSNLEHKDFAKRSKVESKTPSRQHALSKQKILEKKASRISNSDKKTSHKSTNFKANDIFADPRTPAKDRKLQTVEDTLPDIPTDDEDNKSHKVLQSWAETPQLHKIVMQNRTIDPVTIFGEVPRLNIEEIFESQASRYRGKSSPSNFTPDEKQRKREATEYAIKMGYKDSAHL